MVAVYSTCSTLSCALSSSSAAAGPVPNDGGVENVLYMYTVDDAEHGFDGASGQCNGYGGRARGAAWRVSVNNKWPVYLVRTPPGHPTLSRQPTTYRQPTADRQPTTKPRQTVLKQFPNSSQTQELRAGRTPDPPPPPRGESGRRVTAPRRAAAAAAPRPDPRLMRRQS
jgi:hypothetical protein